MLAAGHQLQGDVLAASLQGLMELHGLEMGDGDIRVAVNQHGAQGGIAVFLPAGPLQGAGFHQLCVSPVGEILPEPELLQAAIASQHLVGPAVGQSRNPGKQALLDEVAPLGDEIDAAVIIHQGVEGRHGEGLLRRLAQAEGIAEGLRRRKGAHGSQIAAGGLAPDSDPFGVIAILLRVAAEEAHRGFDIADRRGIGCLGGQPVVHAGAGEAVIPEVAVHELGLAGLSVVEGEAAPVDQDEERGGGFPVGHIEIHILSFRIAGIGQADVSFSAGPVGGFIQGQGGGEHIAPDLPDGIAVHKQQQGEDQHQAQQDPGPDPSFGLFLHGEAPFTQKTFCRKLYRDRCQ